MSHLAATLQNDDQSTLKSISSGLLRGQEKVLAVSDTNDSQVLLVKSLCRNYGGLFAEEVNG